MLKPWEVTGLWAQDMNIWKSAPGFLFRFSRNPEEFIIPFLSFGHQHRLLLPLKTSCRSLRVKPDVLTTLWSIVSPSNLDALVCFMLMQWRPWSETTWGKGFIWLQVLVIVHHWGKTNKEAKQALKQRSVRNTADLMPVCSYTIEDHLPGWLCPQWAGSFHINR